MPECSDLREWLFQSQTGVGVGVRNYLGVGVVLVVNFYYCDYFIKYKKLLLDKDIRDITPGR
jgi:hypothetical protein